MNNWKIYTRTLNGERIELASASTWEMVCDMANHYRRTKSDEGFLSHDMEGNTYICVTYDIKMPFKSFLPYRQGKIYH